MKYYAVTEDPNELIHWGRKGMKWGKHIFGKERERSQAFKNAAKKLRSGVKTVKSGVNTIKSGIKATQAQWRKASAERAKDNERKWAQKMHQQDQDINDEIYNYNTNKMIKKIRKEIKADDKAHREQIKSEKLYDKRVQQAREGTLKYGGLSDEQVMRLTRRLQMENTARQLGGKEPPKFRKRLKQAIQEGTLTGTALGTSQYIQEKLKARGQYEATKKYGKKRARDEARAQVAKDRIINRAKDKHDDRRDEERYERNMQREEAKAERQRTERERTIRDAMDYGGKLEYDKNGNLRIAMKDSDQYYKNKYITGKTVQQQEDEQKRLDNKQARHDRRIEWLYGVQRKLENYNNRKEAEREQARQRAEQERLYAAESERERQRLSSNITAYANEIQRGISEREQRKALDDWNRRRREREYGAVIQRIGEVRNNLGNPRIGNGKSGTIRYGQGRIAIVDMSQPKKPRRRGK